MSVTTEEESPLRKWLIDRGANQLFDYPIIDIESLFVAFDPRTQNSPSVAFVEMTSNAHYSMTHGDLKRAIRHAVHMWQIDLEEHEGRDKAIQLLFRLEQVWDLLLYINEGTEEMEAAIFENERYWPELRIALGYPEWDEERLKSWKKSWDGRLSTYPGETCNACAWRMTT